MVRRKKKIWEQGNTCSNRGKKSLLLGERTNDDCARVVMTEKKALVSLNQGGITKVLPPVDPGRLSAPLVLMTSMKILAIKDFN